MSDAIIKCISPVDRMILLSCLVLSITSAQTEYFGFNVDMNHNVSYSVSSPQNNPITLSDTLRIDGLGNKQYTYPLPSTPALTVGGDFGKAKSDLTFSITPSRMLISWDGSSEVYTGSDISKVTMDARSRMSVYLTWNETFTILNDFTKPGEDVELSLSNGVKCSMAVDNEPQDSARLDFLTDFSTPYQEFVVSWNASIPEVPNAPTSLDKYDAKLVAVKPGDRITLFQSIRGFGQSYVQLIDGKPPVGGGANGRVTMSAQRSLRVGIRAITPGTRIISASGHVYPLHAMSPEAVQSGLDSLRIKNTVYNPITGLVSFTLDAIPGASYVLEKSTDLRTWLPVSTPQIPPNFQEIILVDTPADEPHAFWRVRATPL